MLNKVATPATWAPARWDGWRRGLLAGPTSALLRYALALMILCLITCLYLLQANQLARLNEATLRLQQEAAQLERQNLTLKLQLAQWNSPAYVRHEALKRNYVRDPSVLYVFVPAAQDAAGPSPAAPQTAQVK